MSDDAGADFSSLPRSAVLISFSGMDGAGKSTQIQMLCEQLSAAGHSLLQLAFWDHVVAFPRWRAGFSHKFLKSDGQVGTPERPANRNDKNNRAWYLLLGRSALFLFDAWKLRKIVERAQRDNVQFIIFDRYIYDQLATLPLESAWARAYARLVLRFTPKPDIAYVLDAEPEAARERKPEYPLDFLYRYRKSYHALANLGGLALIPPMSQEDVHRAIVRRVQTVTPSPVAPVEATA
ncbi:MAG TPA: thymidylate kinase [Terriglobales bacterium]|nr:thymidylate kinase [Terriglobales bacterium]